MVKQRSFAVIGLGTFGYQTAVALYEGGAEVIAMDLDKSIVQQIRNNVTQAVCGDATDEEVLTSVGILECDVAVVAIRNEFETTVHVTHLLKSSGMETIYVQVNNPRESGAILALGASEAIFPESDMAGRLARQLLYSNVTDLLPIGPQIGLIDVAAPKAFVDKSLIELDIRKNHRVSVVAIRRRVKRRLRTEEVVVEPSADEPIQEGDILVILGNVKRLSAFRSSIGEAK